MEQVRPNPDGSLRAVKVVQVIMTEALVGKGTPEEPCYIERLYWSMDGELLAVGVFGG